MVYKVYVLLSVMVVLLIQQVVTFLHGVQSVCFGGGTPPSDSHTVTFSTPEFSETV